MKFTVVIHPGLDREFVSRVISKLDGVVSVRAMYPFEKGILGTLLEVEGDGEDLKRIVSSHTAVCEVEGYTLPAAPLDPTAMVAAYGAAPWTEDVRDETWDVTITKFGSKLEVVKALRLLFDIDLKEAFDFCTVTYGDMLFGRVINGGFTSEIAGNIVRTLESVGCVADLTLHIPSRHTNKWRLK